MASPSERAYATVNESPEAITFSWSITTTPVEIKGMKPSACITIDSTKVEALKLKALEDALYGTEEKEAHLPLPEELMISNDDLPNDMNISYDIFLATEYCNDLCSHQDIHP